VPTAARSSLVVLGGGRGELFGACEQFEEFVARTAWVSAEFRAGDLADRREVETAEVLVRDGEAHLVRERQTFEDMVRGEKIPS